MNQQEIDVLRKLIDTAVAKATACAIANDQDHNYYYLGKFHALMELAEKLDQLK